MSVSQDAGLDPAFCQQQSWTAVGHGYAVECTQPHAAAAQQQGLLVLLVLRLVGVMAAMGQQQSSGTAVSPVMGLTALLHTALLIEGLI